MVTKRKAPAKKTTKKATAKAKGASTEAVGMPLMITAPNFQTVTCEITGVAPFVQLRFPKKVKELLRKKHEAGSTGKKGAKREKRDFNEDYAQSFYQMEGGGFGIPAASFRNAMISACRVAGFQMTKAKLTVFTEADGYDIEDGTPLVKITGKPEMVIHPVRNATGVADLRVRAMWREWSAKVRLRFDADMFTVTDVMNLLARVGMQVGIGEGRPDSKSSAGMGWGLFTVEAQ
jgi:hypothetical protein